MDVMRDDVPDATFISKSDGECSDDDLSVSVESSNTTECCVVTLQTNV